MMRRCPEASAEVAVDLVAVVLVHLFIIRNIRIIILRWFFSR